MNLRLATPDDAAALRELMAEGFEGYRDFAPEGWEPALPPLEAMRDRLELTSHWCAVVTDETGEVVAHVAFLDAADSGHPDNEPGLAHLWQMFARPAYWGTGIAPQLMTFAVETARDLGYTAMRLFTPTGAMRPRRFYEREGWSLARPPAFDERIGLEIAEYRRAL